jgi:oligogalacturonide lyase
MIKVILFCILSLSIVYGQVVEGVDYSDRAKVYKTFDMYREDVFGQRFFSENVTYKDKVTGVTVNALTTSRRRSSTMYQTHPQWTADGKYIIFRSSLPSRNPRERGMSQYYAISMDNFEIVQITTGERGGAFHLGWNKNMAYRFRDYKLIEINLGKLLKDSENDKVGKPQDYEKILATLPDSMRANGIGLDAKENRIFFSTRLDDNLSAIYSIDFESGKVKQELQVPFRIGHLQSNPYVSGEVMYCWETGGDSPQRMWYMTVNEDGTVKNRPLYNETDYDWVTHEVFMGPDHILFHLMGHLDRLRENQTGILSMNIRTGESTFHGQTGGGGYWHCNATRDRKWIAADTFDGKICRLNSEDLNGVTLLTQGHRLMSISPFTREAHSHHSISPDGKWVLFNSSLFTESDIMLVPLFPEK